MAYLTDRRPVAAPRLAQLELWREPPAPWRAVSGCYRCIAAAGSGSSIGGSGSSARDYRLHRGPTSPRLGTSASGPTSPSSRSHLRNYPLDQHRADPPRREVRVGHHVAQEFERRADSADPKARQRLAHALQRLLAIRAVDDELADHRVVVRAAPGSRCGNGCRAGCWAPAAAPTR